MAARLLRAWKLRTPSHMVRPSATSWSKEYLVGSCFTSQYCRGIARSERGLEQPGGAHAAADAHRDDAPALALPLQLEQQRAGHPGTGHAVRMSDGDRAAVRVQLIHRDAEPVAAVHDLRGEGLVQLDDVDVVDGEAGALEQLRHREHR